MGSPKRIHANRRRRLGWHFDGISRVIELARRKKMTIAVLITEQFPFSDMNWPLSLSMRGGAIKAISIL
jgi:hypothetical protein